MSYCWIYEIQKRNTVHCKNKSFAFHYNLCVFTTTCTAPLLFTLLFAIDQAVDVTLTAGHIFLSLHSACYQSPC